MAAASGGVTEHGSARDDGEKRARVDVTKVATLHAACLLEALLVMPKDTWTTPNTLDTNSLLPMPLTPHE